MLVFMGVIIHLKDELLIAYRWNPEKIKDEGKIPTWEDSSTEEYRERSTSKWEITELKRKYRIECFIQMLVNMYSCSVLKMGTLMWGYCIYFYLLR